MSVSEFRRQKLYFVFDRFFDVNHSGTIEKKDFELAVEISCQKLRGLGIQAELRAPLVLMIYDVLFIGLVTVRPPMIDYSVVCQRKQICRIRGWYSGEPKYEETRTRFLEIWEALRIRADSNKDEQVSREEWCQLWTGDSNSEDWQKSYMNFMFHLQDTSGDGCIDVEEFTSVCSSFGIDSAESRRAFETLSKNGKAIVDLDYYSGLWKDYFSSDDPSALGNFIFGKTSFP